LHSLAEVWSFGVGALISNAQVQAIASSASHFSFVSVETLSMFSFTSSVVTSISRVFTVRTAQTVAVAWGLASSGVVTTIQVGDSITWTHSDDMGLLTVTSTLQVGGTPLFQSRNLEPGSSYTVTFDTAGTFTYFSATQVSLTGTVIVQGTARRAAVDVSASQQLQPASHFCL
jgi:plastocyanin